MSNDIELFFHCGNCLDDIPPGESAATWSNLGIGWTEKGLQVICNRCDMNVINLDFMGQKVETI